jgi:glyoxylase-like metal-dependent hydrolase (beta-lactamase superfamily II)
MKSDWFATRLLEPGVHLVGEPVHVNCFLVTGDRRAVLIDSGLGIANIREVVDSLTDLDVMVVNTHYHFDHSNGNHLFSEIAIHEEGVGPLGQGVPADVLEGYMKYTAEMLARFDVYRELDDAFFHLLSEETTPRPLPAGFDPKNWARVPSVPTRVLTDGDVVDLGGRRLRVLHTPGHTPDCICLLDEDNGVLFGGDTINTGPIYAQLPDSDVKAFAQSTRRLADEVTDVRVVYMPHFLRYAMDPPLLGEIADGFEAVVAGDVEWRANVDCLGFAVLEALFDRFSIFVSDESMEAGPPTARA